MDGPETSSLRCQPRSPYASSPAAVMLETCEKSRKLPARTLILRHIDGAGGPLWRYARNELEHAVYDAVCRRFYQFLMDAGAK